MAQFTVDPNQFPLQLRGQLLPKDWKETKWIEKTVYLRRADGAVTSVSLQALIDAAGEEGDQFAGIELVNRENGRQVFFGLNPESVPGNQFSGLLYHERAGGGSTLVFAAQKPNGDWVVALLDQERPLQNQTGAKILQVPGGYPIEMAGTPDQIHRATAIAEGASEVVGGKYRITTEELVNLYAPYNTNNGMVITGKGQGIATQLLVIPFELLEEQSDDTYSLSRDSAEVADRRLERIFAERFHNLTPALIKKVHQPEGKYAACTKTVMAIDRAYFFLVMGI